MVSEEVGPGGEVSEEVGPGVLRFDRRLGHRSGARGGEVRSQVWDLVVEVIFEGVAEEDARGGLLGEMERRLRHHEQPAEARLDPSACMW
jgi:hypothetical protein